MLPAVGIDLGTTKSLIGIWRDGRCRLIPDNAGHQSIPSMVMVTADGRILAGRLAQKHPDRYKSKNITISSVKRLMGRKGETGWGWWKTYPQEVSAFILTELKSQAERYLGEDIKRAVIAIPSHFDEAQRRATKEAAEIAGLEVTRLLNEATAAVLDYGFHRQGEEMTLVFDFGGGTLDISVVERGEGTYQVKSIEGDTKLGGDDFDQVILDYILDKVHQQYGSAIEWDPIQKAILREAAEKAKVELSSTLATSIYIPGFLRIGQGFHDLNILLERPTFEQLSKSLVDRAITLLKKALDSANVKVSNLGSLLLLGGTSRIPFIREAVRKKLGVEPITGVDVETCVAQGAIIQAAILEGMLRDVLILDCVPSSYGVGLKDDTFLPLIKKNSTVPTANSQKFTTTMDNQTTIPITIYQGESQKASENSFLGTIELRDIPPAAVGIPQIQVTFDVDANMIVRAKALDLGTGKGQTIAVKSPYGLNSVQVKVMQQRLKSWLSERQITEIKSEIGSLIPVIEKILAERATALSWDEVLTLREHCTSLSKTVTKKISYVELTSMLLAIRSIVDKAQQKIAQYERVVQDINNLATKVESLAPLVRPEAEKPFILLSQGADLLKDYLQRNSSYDELQKILSAVRNTYEETKTAIIQIEIKNLRTSEKIAEWVGEAERGLSNSSLVRQSLLKLKSINSVELVVKLLGVEDVDYRTSIQRKVFEGIKGDSCSGAYFFLIVLSFIDPHVVSDIDRVPLNENNSAILAFSICNSLDINRSDDVRRTAAQAVANYLPDIKYVPFIVDRISSEPDTTVKKYLLDYVNKQPPGVFEKFYMDASTETRARIIANKDLLVKLAEEPDPETRIFALESLANFPPEEAVPAFIYFARSQDPNVRAKALEQILKSKSSDIQISDLFAQALSDPVLKIRLLAIGFMEQEKGPSCLSRILTLLQSEKDEIVRERAVAALCNLGAPGVIAHLLRLLISEGQNIRAIVLSSLEKDKEAMDEDTRRLFDLTKRIALGEHSISLKDSVFFWRFSRKHPEMKDLVQTLKERRAGR